MIKQLFISLCCCLLLSLANAQETFYVPDSALVYFGNQSPAAIFGYVRNSGNIAIKKDGQLFFLGKIWMNENKGKLTDEGLVSNSVSGGIVQFTQPNPVYGNLGQQILHTAFNDSDSTGPSFSNITIDNLAGVILSSDIQVLNTLHFKKGHLYLNYYNYIAGNENSPGKFSGYDQNRFIVNGSEVAGGFVKYRKVNTGVQITFPIGITKEMYTPLQLTNKGTADAFMARAFQNVYTNATNGVITKDSTLPITWMLRNNIPSHQELMVKLQNEKEQEDPVFNNNRTASFVSLYDSATGWDKPYFKNAPQIPGDITSAFASAGSLANSRRIYMKGDFLFLTKKVSNKKVTFIIPNVFSPNGDGINDTWNIKGLNENDFCRVEIYNRYGQVIFTSTGYKKPWDGTYNGKPVPVAAYYYIIDLRDGQKPLSGSITVLR